MKTLYNDILAQIQKEKEKYGDKISKNKYSQDSEEGAVSTFTLPNTGITNITVNGIVYSDSIDIIIGCEPIVFPRIKKDLQDYLLEGFVPQEEQVNILRAVHDEVLN